MPDLINFGGGTALLMFMVVIVGVLLAAYVFSRYRVAQANEALIVAGSKGAKVRDASGKMLLTGDQGIRVVVGGGTIVWPLRNKVGRLELTARQIKVALPDAITCQGIKVQVEGVATFKIGRDVESIRNAAERFLGTNQAQIDDIVKNVLEGSLRSIVGTLTIEELIMDREKLLQRVQDSAKLDLATTGIEIDSFTIQSIEDSSGYITQLGLQKLAPVTRDAKIAQAVADQEAAVKQAEAEQIKINAARDVALRQAEAQQLTATAKARADQAEPLARAEAQREVVRTQTELALLEAERREKELLAATVKPAEAEAAAAVRRAEGEKASRIAIAEADARRAQLAGEAEARVTLTKGQAEAEALALKAEAYQQYNQAAILQTILDKLPQLVRAAAEPLASIDSLTVLSTNGASDVVRTTTETVAQANATLKAMTGIDVAALVTAAAAGDGNGQHQMARRLVHHLGEELDIQPVGAGPNGNGHSADGNGAAADEGSARSEELMPPAAATSTGTGTGTDTAVSNSSTGAGSAARRARAEAAAARAAEAVRSAVESASTSAGAVAAAATAAASAATAPATTPQAHPAPAAPAPVGAGPAAPTPATVPAQPVPTQPVPAAPGVPPAAPPAARSMVDQVLHEMAVRVRALPGANTAPVRALRLDDINWRAPSRFQEVWAQYGSRIPEEYRGMTIGQLIDRYGG